MSKHSMGLQGVLYDGLRTRRWLRLSSTILGNESNKCNPYAGANNYHLTKQRQAAVCLSAQHELRLFELSLVRM